MVFIIWIKRRNLAGRPVINPHIVSAVRGPVQRIWWVDVFICVHCKPQNHFHVYYFSCHPQITSRKIDGNWINGCVYLKAGLVEDKTDLLDDTFNFFSYMPVLIKTLHSKQGELEKINWGSQTCSSVDMNWSSPGSDHHLRALCGSVASIGEACVTRILYNCHPLAARLQGSWFGATEGTNIKTLAPPGNLLWLFIHLKCLTLCTNQITWLFSPWEGMWARKS